MKYTDTHVYFWGGPFSNWDNCHFVCGGIKFHNTEQAFMWWKAKFFNDEETAKKIELEFNPSEVKRLGRLVKNYKDDECSVVRMLYMIEVNEQKFNQNPFYKEILIRTENRVLVEASPYDKIWGVGLAEDNPLILDEKNWLGQNLLGKALMEVRKKIKNEKTV